MGFCASCGRQRIGTARFCGGCGAEFTDSPADAADQVPAAADAAAEPLADVTSMDVAPEVSRTEPPDSRTDPFASWYQQGPQGARDDAESTWQPTQTVNVAQGQAPGYPPSPPPEYQASGFTPANPFSSANPIPPAGPYAPPPGPPGSPAGPPARGGRRGLFITLAVIVVLAAGGGAYALATTLGKHSTAQPPASPTAATSAAASSTGGATQQASSPTTSPTPSPTLSLVSIAPGVAGSAAQPQVETLLSHYFQGINNHDYTEYADTLNPQERAKQSQAEFNSGYSSTSDSGMTLTGLSDNGNGALTATVTFTSRQSAGQSVDKSACDAWTLNLYLVSQGTGYLIGPAPSGYQPTYSDC
jgi:hypothetical protein